MGGHFCPARWNFVQGRHVEVPEHGHRNSAWDRRRRHHQHMRMRAIGGSAGQGRTLLDAEAMLFVDHHQPQARKLHGFLE